MVKGSCADGQDSVVLACWRRRPAAARPGSRSKRRGAGRPATAAPAAADSPSRRRARRSRPGDDAGRHADDLDEAVEARRRPAAATANPARKAAGPSRRRRLRERRAGRTVRWQRRRCRHRPGRRPARATSGGRGLQPPRPRRRRLVADQGPGGVEGPGLHRQDDQDRQHLPAVGGHRLRRPGRRRRHRRLRQAGQRPGRHPRPQARAHLLRRRLRPRPDRWPT